MTKEKCVETCGHLIGGGGGSTLSIEHCKTPRNHRICGMILWPVCDNKGKTHSNKCLFKWAKCDDPTLEIVREGDCKKGSLIQVLPGVVKPPAPQVKPAPSGPCAIAAAKIKAMLAGPHMIADLVPPSCNADGTYKPVQCYPMTGCRCVTKDGKTIS